MLNEQPSLTSVPREESISEEQDHAHGEFANVDEQTAIDNSASELTPDQDELVDHVDQTQHNKMPVPAMIKFGLPALIALVLVTAGLGASYFISTDKEPDAEIAAESMFEIGGASIESNTHTPNTNASANDERLSYIEADINSIESLLPSLQQDYSNLQADFEKAIASLSSRDKDLNELRISLSEITDTLIPGLSVTDKRQAVMLADLRAESIKNKQLINQSKNQKIETPPFTVVSIDEWGGVASAVIIMDGRSTVASIGDVRSGWRIINIVQPDCIHVMRVNGTKTMNICGVGVL